MESKIDKSDVDKLMPVPIDLRQPSDVVKTDVVTRTEYDELA